MNRHYEPISKARAVLGAMSWRVPDDDWDSPWSFESEWIIPDAAPSARTEAAETELETAPDDSLLVRRLPQVPSSASPVSPITPHGVMLRFEESEPPEIIPPSARAAPSPPAEAGRAASVPVADDVRFRPPETRPAEVTPAPKMPGAGVPAIRSETVGDSLPARSGPALPEFKPEPVMVPPPRVRDRGEEVSADERERKRVLRRRASGFSWGSLISLSLGTLGFTLLAWIYLHDSPRESDEDLRPQVAVDQAPTIQAPTKLKAFLDSIIPVENGALRSQPAWIWDTPSLSAFIRANGTALDNLRDLLEDYDWHPHHSEWYREDLSGHPGWGNAACLLQAHAAYLARRGDEDPAFVVAIDLAEMSRRLQDVWAWPGYMDRALELQSASVQILAELLKATRLDAAALERFQNEFIQCQPDDELMRQAYAAYYIHEKKLLLGSASLELLDTMPGGRLHQRPGRLFFKMNETLGLFASAFRDLRDEIRRPPYTRLSVSASPSSRIRLTSPRFYHPNSSGETYFSDRIEPHLRLPLNHSLAQARHGLVRCLFGLRRYLADRHTLPGQLNDLTPHFLPSIPQDPFSGEPLRYAAAKGLLYSVGVNLIDEGGRPGEVPMGDDREPTVELGIAIAVPIKR